MGEQNIRVGLRLAVWLALRALGILLIIGDPKALGQGTVRFGFESDPIGTTPPYVTVAQPFSRHSAAVADATAWLQTAAEGGRFLAVRGAISIGSEGNGPIESFSLRVFLPGPPVNPTDQEARFRFGVGNTTLSVIEFTD